MNSADKQSPHDVFLNVRKAYRLLHDYQCMVLDVVRYIRSQLDIHNYTVYQRRGGSFKDDSNTALDISSWGWLPMVNCEIRFWKKMQNDEDLSLSFLITSDTGFIEGDAETKFALPDESKTKFAFILHANCWMDKIVPFMENEIQMRNFIKAGGSLPDDLIKAGAVGKCYDMSCLTSEAEANRVVSDVIEAAKARSWPLKLRKEV